MSNLLNLTPGSQVGTSDWVQITQEKINAFAQATGDFQWIHIDKERCAQQSPFGSTIAHGFLSATLMPALFYPMLELPEGDYSILNYGVDKIRFLEPVRVNDNIRYHISLESRDQKKSGILFNFACKVEIEDRDKAAMVGSFLTLLVQNG